MTLQRHDEHGTEFGEWLRNQPEIESRLKGFITSNIDYVWRNCKTHAYMLIEEKRHNALLSPSQAKIFKQISDALKHDEKFKGFHYIRFENTSPDDGRIFLDNKEVSRDELIKFLRFEYYYWPTLKTNGREV